MNALLQILLSALLGAWSGDAAHAQDGAAARDPMRPPAAAIPPPPPASLADPAAAAAAVPKLRQLMVVDGRRYVVIGTRRLAVGDLLGTARIERIEDAAVVVREGGTLQRLPLYTSAATRPHAHADVASAPAPAPALAHAASAPPAARPPRRGAPS